MFIVVGCFSLFSSFLEGGHIRPQTCKQTALAEVNFTSMVAAFGTRKPQKWADYRLLENHPVLRVGGLRGTEVTVSVNGISRSSSWSGNGPSVSDVRNDNALGFVVYPAIDDAVRFTK